MDSLMDGILWTLIGIAGWMGLADDEPGIACVILAIVALRVAFAMGLKVSF